MNHQDVSGQRVAYVNSELKDLIPWFLENRQKDLATIAKLADDGNFSELERIGHTLKGTCGGYGFADLGLIGAKIEFAAKARDKNEILVQNEEMRTYLEQVQVVYQ